MEAEDPQQLRPETREALDFINERLAQKRKRDRTFYAAIGEQWYKVKDDPAVNRGDLKKLAPDFKHHPDFLQRCLRLWQALLTRVPKADAWQEQTDFDNLAGSEPFRTIHLLNSHKNALRLESSQNDPIRCAETDRNGTALSRVLQGDCRIVLRRLPDNHFELVVTSFPYHWQRDYKNPLQIGMEDTEELYLQHVYEVLVELYRVMTPRGIAFINIDDRYATASRTGDKFPDWTVRRPPPKPHDAVAALKNLIGTPNDFARLAQLVGFYVRSEIIWVKPGSTDHAKDRPAHIYEKIFMLSKSATYDYDDSERVPSRSPTRRVGTKRRLQSFSWVGDGTRRQTDVWDDLPRETHIKGFAPAFPEALPERCILLTGRKTGNLLDPFVGTGTSVLVADRMGWHGTGIELVPETAAFARRRIGLGGIAEAGD